MNPVFDTAKDQLLKVFLRMNALVFQVSLLASVLILVYLGIKYSTHPGDLAKNHKNLLYVLVGVMLLSLAAIIPTILLSFLK